MGPARLAALQVSSEKPLAYPIPLDCGLTQQQHLAHTHFHVDFVASLFFLENGLKPVFIKVANVIQGDTQLRQMQGITSVEYPGTYSNHKLENDFQVAGVTVVGKGVYAGTNSGCSFIPGPSVNSCLNKCVTLAPQELVLITRSSLCTPSTPGQVRQHGDQIQISASPHVKSDALTGKPLC